MWRLKTQKIWRADNAYDSLVIMFGLMLIFAIMNMFTVGLTTLNVIAAVVAVVVCGLSIWHAWKMFDLDMVVNKYLQQHKCIEWIEEVTPVFWSGRLASVVIDLKPYFMVGVEGEYYVSWDNVDSRIAVYRFEFMKDQDRVMTVVEYQGQVDVYTNKLEDMDE